MRLTCLRGLEPRRECNRLTAHCLGIEQPGLSAPAHRLVGSRVVLAQISDVRMAVSASEVHKLMVTGEARNRQEGRRLGTATDSFETTEERVLDPTTVYP